MSDNVFGSRRKREVIASTPASILKWLRLNSFLSKSRIALLGAVLATAPATLNVALAQQGDWVNPDIIALRDEVRRLQAEVAGLRGGGGGAIIPAEGFDGSSGVPSDFLLRLDQIDGQMRSLVGRMEELEFQQRQSAQTQTASLEDLRFRVEAIESAVDGVAPPHSAQSSAQNSLDGAPAQSGLSQSSQAGGITSQQPASGGADGLNAGGQGVLRGAPPRPLGVLPSQDGAAVVQQQPIYDATRPPQSTQLAPLDGSSSETTQVAASASADDAYRNAVERVRAGAFEDAEQELSSFVASYPSDPRVGDAKYWLGETHYVRGQFAEAARVFLDAYREHPGASRAPDSLLKLGMTLSQLNQRDEACLTFSEVSARFPNAPANVRNRAQIEAKRASCP